VILMGNCNDSSYSRRSSVGSSAIRLRRSDLILLVDWSAAVVTQRFELDRFSQKRPATFAVWTYLNSVDLAFGHDSPPVYFPADAAFTLGRRRSCFPFMICIISSSRSHQWRATAMTRSRCLSEAPSLLRFNRSPMSSRAVVFGESKNSFCTRMLVPPAHILPVPARKHMSTKVMRLHRPLSPWSRIPIKKQPHGS